MMQQNIRSQTPGMNPVPNSQQGMPGPGMGQPRMVGPQGNVSKTYIIFYHLIRIFQHLSYFLEYEET